MFCCSTAVRSVWTSSPGVIYPTGWTRTGTALSERPAAFQQVPHARSAKHGLSQLWGSPGKPTPDVQNSRSKTRAQLLLGFRPHLPKPAHFTRQYFCYWSERHSLKSVTTKNMLILYIPKPLHVPMDSSINASISQIFQDTTHTNSSRNSCGLQHHSQHSFPCNFPGFPQL